MAIAALTFKRPEQVARLPRITWDKRKQLPDGPGLYFVIIDGRVIYVGKSDKSLRGRWNQYPYRRKFEKIGAFEVAYLEIPDLTVLAASEKRTIRALRPDWNVHYVDGALEHWREVHRRYRDLRT